MKRHDLLIATLLTVALTCSTPSVACSPMPPEPAPPCTAMSVWTPGERMPVNLAHLIRVSTLGGDAYAWRPRPWSEHEIPRPQVFRAENDGWRAVEFSLVDQEGLVASARQLRLADPRPGRYLVVWEDETCATGQPPAGTGREVGRFELTARVERPGRLGEAASPAPEIVHEKVHRGTGADCSDIYARETVLYLPITVELDEALGPWMNVLETAIVDDEGRFVRGYAPVAPADVEDGVYRTRLRHVCSASDRQRVSNRLDEGEHTVTVLGKLGDGEPIAASPVTLRLACPGTGRASG